jgi:hypothetical protein
MSEDITCFMLQRTDRVARWLRRYVTESNCPLNPLAIHDAAFRIEDGPLVRTPEGYVSTESSTIPETDDRWPQKCSCSFIFRPDDVHQLFILEIYLTPQNQEVSVHSSPPPGIDKAPPGAMWFSDFYPWKGPDGHTLSVLTPGGIWIIDGPTSKGTRPWSRTGVPPKVTVHPSINFEGSYHGWLRDGVLSPAG